VTNNGFNRPIFETIMSFIGTKMAIIVANIPIMVAKMAIMNTIMNTMVSKKVLPAHN
jgi:hypothetical protein